jgi:hypothetical protein
MYVNTKIFIVSAKLEDMCSPREKFNKSFLKHAV